MPRQKHMIYLDHNATTPASSEVLRHMSEAEWGNPNSIHPLGFKASNQISYCEQTIIECINGEKGRLIWTSSGSEANRLAITGVCNGARSCLSSPVSHKSIYDIRLSNGMALNVDAIGRVDPSSQRLFNRFIKLISIPYVNNETGVFDFPNEIKDKYPSTYLHVDAVQALGKTPIDIEAMKADLVTLSAHKIYGPKGIGCLWIREGVEINLPYLGTPNTPAILGFAVAVSQIDWRENIQHCKELEHLFLDTLDAHDVDYHINFPQIVRLPGTLSMSFKGIDCDELTMALGTKGVMISTGSACNKEGNISYILSNIGLSDEVIQSTVRISIGKENNVTNIQTAALIIAETIKELQDDGSKLGENS